MRVDICTNLWNCYSANLDLVTPYDSVPGFPRGYRLGMKVTDREMFEFFFDKADSWAVLVEIKGILEQKDNNNTAKAEEVFRKYLQQEALVRNCFALVDEKKQQEDTTWNRKI